MKQATVIGLFTPLRRWVQGRVDRKFNRAGYDAAHAVETFRTQLRAELDLESLSTHLLAPVNATVQPVLASVWIPDTPEAL